MWPVVCGGWFVMFIEYGVHSIVCVRLVHGVWCMEHEVRNGLGRVGVFVGVSGDKGMAHCGRNDGASGGWGHPLRL